MDGVPKKDGTAPVNLQLTPADAFMRIRGWSLPVPILPMSILGGWGGRGTISGSGDVSIPVGQISAPADFSFPRDINGEEEEMIVSLSARGDWTGNVNPLNGVATMHFPTTLRIRADRVRMVDIPWPGGWIYGNIDCTVPLDFGPMTTARMAPPDPAPDMAPATSGLPYSAATGQFTVVNNSMAIGGFDCTRPDIGSGEVEDQLNEAVAIPAPPGRTDSRFNLTFLEGGNIVRPKPAIRPGFEWVQGAPYEIALDAGDTYAKAGVLRYAWDMDEDKKADVVTQAPQFTQRFPSTGARKVGLMVVDKDGDTAGWVTHEVTVGDQAGRGVPQLAPLKISPAKRRAKRGGKTRFRIRVQNVGLAVAEDVTLCVERGKKLRKLIKTPRCASLGDLAPGEVRQRTMRFKVKARARSRKPVRLTFRAEAAGGYESTAKARIRIKRSAGR